MSDLSYFTEQDSNILLGREEFLNCFKFNCNANEKYILLFVKSRNREIIPSLSVIMDLDKRITLPHSIDELYDEQKGQSRIFKKEFIKNFLIGDLRVVFDDHTNNLIVLASSKLDTKQKQFFKSYVELMRRSSLNYFNESHKLTVRDSDILKGTFNDNIKITAENLTKEISILYQCECYLFQKQLDGTYVNTENSNMLDFVNSKIHVLQYGRPLFFKWRKRHLLLMPFMNDAKTVQLHFFFCLSFKGPIKKYVTINLIKSFNVYFNSFLPKQHQKHISDLQESISEIYNNKIFDLSNIRVIRDLISFGEKAFSKLVLSTDAHSATIRLFREFDNTLIRAFHEADEKIPKKKKYAIKAGHETKSVNVYTFTHCGRSKFFYAKDVLAFKGKYQEYDQRVTKSELCFPLYFKDIKIGTIHYESSFPRAFGNSLYEIGHGNFGFHKIALFQEDALFNYFLTVKNIVEEYVQILFEQNDKFWLARRIDIYQNIHELKSLLEKELDNSDRIIIENAIYGVHQNFNLKDTFNLVETIKTFLADYLGELKRLRTETYYALSEKIRFDYNAKSLRHNINTEFKNSLDIIFKNILNNFIKGASPSSKRESIHIKLSNNVLRIKIDFIFDGYSKINLNSYLVRPYKSEDGVHYGLFLIGMLVRHLRGACFLKEPNEHITIPNHSTIILRIPIPSKKHEYE